eukprot:TRINITY_DN503_c2_g1_i1.p1 TRINITY_DN503_c2_g1~~TRINITY_DN503_c2_g1_i1.p1  ORF type:complete len:211 (-),score=65.42 TRINITY_DN503_c2_g1_i1:18-611(-)
MLIEKDSTKTKKFTKYIIPSIFIICLILLWYYYNKFDKDIEVIWPLIVITPGISLLIIGSLLKHFFGHFLFLSGSVVTIIGLLLFYQNWYIHWQSWLYTWTLIPFIISISHYFYFNFISNQIYDKQFTNFVNNLAFYLLILSIFGFLSGIFLFEFIIGISGYKLSQFGWAILLIAIGIGFLSTYLIQIYLQEKLILN